VGETETFRMIEWKDFSDETVTLPIDKIVANCSKKNISHEPARTQCIDTWQANNRINLMLLEELNDEALASTLSKRGGRTVAQQLAHIHAVRLQWLEIGASRSFTTQTKIDKEGKIDKAYLKKAWRNQPKALHSGWPLQMIRES